MIFLEFRLLVLLLMSFFSIAHAIGKSPHILIHKDQRRLYLIQNGDTIMNVSVCLGQNYGNKKRKGDCRTPEGKFTVSQILDSRLWKHDFGDGGGLRNGAYGPYFFRLKIPGWTSIGIHGTCFPESIGKRESEGCIRLNNRDLIKLREYIGVGTEVIILPDT